MSEPKRATLSTITTQKSDVKKVKEVSKTVRFSLTLPESNEKACPEYNYRDLLNSAEKKNRLKEKNSHPSPPNGLNKLDPFEDNDDDVKRIARQFEQKYGTPKQTKRRGKKDDYADIGAGYDESDSFIDNTDAYDEMVPEDVTTLHGGFYINSGALEFKQVDLSATDDDSSESEIPEKTITRKRVIEDSDESSSDEHEKEEETKTENPEKKQKMESNGFQKPAKKKILLDEREQIAKKKKIDDSVKKKTVTVKELLREKREEFNITAEAEELGIDKDNSKAVPSSTISDVIEFVVNAGRGETVDENSKDSTSTEDVAVVSAASSESESSRDGASTMPSSNILSVPAIIEGHAEQSKLDLESITKLPDNVPDNVHNIINDIKKAAENSVGKVKFFSGAVNSMFLNLELQCRRLGKSNRLQIYEHLAPFVKCKKDTLMRRAKNLVLDQEKSKMKEPVNKLKLLVENTMPVLIKNYEYELQRAKEEMFVSNTDISDPSKIKKIPRKRFQWSEEAKKYLQEIIILKKRCFILEGIRKESFEEHLETYFKIGVICLWPEGWMSTQTLMKHAKIILENSSNNAKTKELPATPPITQISVDIQATPVNPIAPYTLSPVKMSHSPTSTSNTTNTSGITVIPLPPTNLQRTSPLSAAPSTNVPKHKPNPSTVRNDISVTVKTEPVTVASAPLITPTITAAPTTVLNMNTEICPVTSSKDNSVSHSSLHVASSKPSGSVTITSVDLRTNTNSKKDILKDNDSVVPASDICKIVNPSTVTNNVDKSKCLLQQIREASDKSSKNNNDDCQIIDLTDSPAPVVRKPGPKSKTKYIDPTQLKPVKRTQEPPMAHRSESSVIQRKVEEITGTQALNNIITGLTKFGSNLTEVNQKPYKDNQSNEDEMEQVMKDLKELQQMQEHARKSDVDIMAPSSSPVSVIAYNSSFSPTKAHQPSDLSTSKERKAEGPGFQDIFQKHLFQDLSMLKQNQSASIYNANIQPKNNYNSIDSYAYSRSGSMSNSLNSHRYQQSSNKYNPGINHIQSNPPGTTNHNDDFALFSNFLYQYGYHNASGPKQKSPP